MLIEIKKEVECWIPIKGYEGFYEVSNLGRIRSLDRISKNSKNSSIFNKGKILKPRYSQKGYEIYALQKNGNRIDRPGHRIVCEIYKYKYGFEELQVNHINGIKNDNRIENLEWVTNKENSLHSFRVLGRKNSGEYAKVPILKFDLDNNFIKKYDSFKEASKDTGLNRTSISRALNNKIINPKKYKWRYA